MQYQIKISKEYIDKRKILFFSVNRKEVIKEVAKKLSLPFLQTERKIRLVGVRVSSLVFGKSFRS